MKMSLLKKLGFECHYSSTITDKLITMNTDQSHMELYQ